LQTRSQTGLIALAAALVALIAGIWWGGHPQALPSFLREMFVSDDVATRAELVSDIRNNFYKEVSEDDLEQAALKGMVSSLDDRFSEYYTPKEAEQVSQALSGQFEGVGMSVNSRDTKDGLRVARVFPESPAREAGIKPGDVITEVNGKSIAGDPADVSTAKIRGPAGTKVTLTYKPAGKDSSETVELERRKLDVPLVDGRIVKRDGTKFAHVRLAEFDSGARDQVRKEIERELKKGAEGVLLDLRGNPGGSLDEGVFVASLFLEKGKPVVSTRGRTQPEREFEATGDPIDPDVPVAVLVDGNSASASEIVTGALRDNERATVVGQETFGKGVFQTLDPLPNDGLLKLTVGSYYLPDGENLAGDGIEPDVKAKDDPETRRDEALPVALRALAAQLR
jgi:carboxyl-terminal processing protease